MSAEAKINVILVDDEKEASANLKSILDEYVAKDINVVGIAHNTADAEKLINSLAPEAVFLDIEMPNENAFHFLDRITPFNFEVIFVTAYDEYAVKAFKLNAVDYILKPISITELTNAVQRLREKLEYKKMVANSSSSYSDLSSVVKNKGKSHKITLKDGNHFEVVDFKNIYFLEAQGSYSRVVFLKDEAVKEMIMSTSLSDYEELMPAELFYRIHKSFMINCMHVKKIIKGEAGQVLINDSYTLPISRRKFLPLLEFLMNNDYYHE